MKRKVITKVFGIIIFCVYYFLLILFLLLSSFILIVDHKPLRYFTSPNGKNTVIVYQFEHSYRAYPKIGIFYIKQNNASVYRGDSQFDVGFKAKWLSENIAKIEVGTDYTNYVETKDNIIFVNFN